MTILRSSGWALAQNLALQFGSFVVFAGLARLLGPSEFGAVAFAMSVLAVIQIVTSAGLTQLVVQAPDIGGAFLDTAFWLNVGLSVLASLLVCGGAMAVMLPSVEREVLLVLCGTLPLSALYAAQQGVLIRSMNFRPFALRAMIGQLVGGAVGLFSALQGAGVWSLVAYRYCAVSVDCATVLLSTGWKPRIRIDLAVLRRLLRPSLGLVFAQLLTVVDTRGVEIIVGAALGSSVLGQYRVATRVNEVMLSLAVRPVSQVALPAFSKGIRQKADFTSLYTGLSALVAWSCIGTSFLAALFAKPMFLLIFGAAWLPSAEIFQVLCGVAVVLALFVLYEPALIANGSMVQLTILRLVQSSSALAVVYFFVDRGLLAMTAVMMGRMYALMPVFYYVLRLCTSLQWRPLLGVVVMPGLAVLASYIGYLFMLQIEVWLGMPEGWWPLHLTVAALVYGAIALLSLQPLIRRWRTSFG